MDQFSMLLDHDADPFMGLDKTGRNILHLLASTCTAHDLRTYMKIVLKKVEIISLLVWITFPASGIAASARTPLQLINFFHNLITDIIVHIFHVTRLSSSDTCDKSSLLYKIVVMSNSS